jgi:hypothetical protein
MTARYVPVVFEGWNGEDGLMRTNTKQMTGRSCVAAHGYYGIIRITHVIAGILFLSLLHKSGEIGAQTLPGLYNVSLSWDASTSPDVAGHIIHYGVESGNYTESMIVENATTVTLSGLTSGITYFFAVTAYTASGLQSDFSDEVSFVPGRHKLGIRANTAGGHVLKVHGQIGHTYDIEATEDFKTWTSISTVVIPDGGSLDFIDTNAAQFTSRFYRTHDTQQ